MIFQTIPEYITILKKNRGILFGIGIDEETDSIKWIISNLKYDELGVSPSLWDKIPQRKNIRHIELPFENADIVIESIAHNADVDFEIVETMAFASSFASPIVALSDDAIDKFRKFSMMTFRGEIPDNSRRKMFYFRACGDSIIDSYAHTLSMSENVLSGDIEFHTAFRTLKTFSLNDAKKRFWQLGDGTQGKKMIMYVSLLPYIENIEIAIDELEQFPFWAIIPVLNIS
ncbi:hypothetical protein J7L68_03925 [bacterium]|nr:hypothetical protein [bacterium]